MNRSIAMDRRSFVKLLGGGIVVTASLGPGRLFGQGRPPYPEDFNAYLRIDENGKVTVFSGKIEMGQGVMTSQAQMAAEELGVALEAIEMVLGDTDRCPWDMGTFGSLTTRMFGPFLRAAAAEAREVLIALAAERLAVSKRELAVENGIVSVVGRPGQRVTYGELARGRAIARHLDEKAVLRSVREFTVMGRSPERLDGLEKVMGRALFAGDIRRPGMLYARILRPPSHGATLTSVDTSRAAAMDNAIVVEREGMVAVLHPDPEGAERALGAIEAVWDEAVVDVDNDSIFDWLVERAPSPGTTHRRGNVETAAASVSGIFEAKYRSGYRAHAPMEPHTAVAEIVDGKLTVWASTQTPFPTRDRIASATRFEPENVRVITPYVGGGFGGKSASGQAVEAARLAVWTGKPVQVAWTRAEEFFFDTFDPATVVAIRSAIDGGGKIGLWDYDVYFGGDRSADLFYEVPHARIRVFGSWRGAGSDTHLFSVGPWRAPGANTNVFARESHIDVMAAAAGVDPLEFRLVNCADERMIAVLRAAGKAAGWKAARSGASATGRGRGVACGIDAGTYVALVADVEVDFASGDVRVERVVAAQDMGIVVNPEGARMQMEGCISMGLGYTFSEELRFEGGNILDRNFGTYTLPRFSWMPEIETVLVENNDLAPQGGGEPAIVPMGAAVANAIFDATGARLTRLPMTPERVREAVEEAKVEAGGSVAAS
jgi:isoquinoline 1-oxidoreductase